MKYGFGIDVGGTMVKIAFFDQLGELLHKWEIPTVTAEGGSRILPDIAAAVRSHLENAGVPKEDVLGIGVGVPGPVDGRGVVNRCVNLGWGVFNLHEMLGELTGLPVKAGNDANMAALGEAWKGGGQGYENMVFATLGTGVGGGVVLGGKVLCGVHGAGGEIGHMVLRKDETEPCGCGKYGCAEQYCSATGLVRMARGALEGFAGVSLLQSAGELTSKAIFDAAAAGDALAAEVLEQYYDCLGEFLANICCVIDPDIVVLGGGVSKAGKPLLEGVRRYFEKYIFHAAREVRLALATLGNDAGVYGAFQLALSEFGNIG
ncbi:MAG TPA: ROK family glucokinase [Candidatus Faecousia intestinigallinarum]|nr:ROK family glucokinase [Candidatus Faecousia intestinigallinarum]